MEYQNLKWRKVHEYCRERQEWLDSYYFEAYSRSFWFHVSFSERHGAKLTITKHSKMIWKGDFHDENAAKQFAQLYLNFNGE